MDVLQFKTAIWNLQRSIAENANALFSSVAAQNGLTPQQAALLLELAQKGLSPHLVPDQDQRHPTM